MAFYHKDIDALFIHVPKAYGSSISNALVRSGFKKISSTDTMSFKKGTLEYIFDKHKENPDIPLDLEKTFIFSFIREPYSRFKSGLHYSKLSYPSIQEKTYNRFQYWHSLMSQKQHLKHPSTTTLDHMNYIGLCDQIDEEWKHLENMLKQRGLKRNLAPLQHRNKTKELHNLQASDDELDTYCKASCSEDFQLYNELKQQRYPISTEIQNEIILHPIPDVVEHVDSGARIYQLHWIGRFGNRIFQYAFINEWARRNKGHGYLPSYWEGTTLFKKSPHCSVVEDDTFRCAINQTGKFDNITFRKEALERFNKRTNQNIEFRDTRCFQDRKHVAFDDLNSMYIRKLLQEMDPEHLRELFEFSDEVKATPVYQDIIKEKGKYIVAHLRRGDISRKNYKGAHSMVTKESYYRAFEQFGDSSENIIWLSDNKQERTNKPYMFSKDYYNCSVGHQWKYPRGEKKQNKDIIFDFLPELLLLVFAKKIYRANSSFSWFGSFLSDAIVYSPIVKPKTPECKGKFFEIDTDFARNNCEPFMGSREEGFQEIYFGDNRV